MIRAVEAGGWNVTVRIRDLVVPVEAGAGEADEGGGEAENRRLLQHLLARLPVPREQILSMEIIRKSLDARRKRRIVWRYQLRLELQDEAALLRRFPFLEAVDDNRRPGPLDDLPAGEPPRHRPVIIGSGPAGIFAAIVLASAGIPAVVIERGQAVGDRQRRVRGLRRQGTFSAESNYCFGEGGAGTFSDGKLSCGRNHPWIHWIFSTLVRFGAPRSILYDAHPHTGTENLMKTSVSIRRWLQDNGTEFCFSTRLDDIRRGNGTARLRAVLSDGRALATDHLILATGHSARDTYRMLLERGVPMEQKPFAMGARIEHPREVIDRIQFGSCRLLPAAEYKLSANTDGRGIWTFCMCPGGHLLPTGAQPGHLAINGMSYHNRSGDFSNAAVVVNVRREDYDRGHVLDGMAMQARLEAAAFAAGGGDYHAPAQRLTDFLRGRPPKSLPPSSYRPGIHPAAMDRLLPEFVVTGLRGAMQRYDQRMRGYIHEEAVVVGLESKTSAPVVIGRDDSLQSPEWPGLYPTGEGAGYAGGIVSAALDGVRVGRALVLQLRS